MAAEPARARVPDLPLADQRQHRLHAETRHSPWRRGSRRSPSGARRGCRLVGHSLGGMISRGLAARRPDLVAGIVTMGSPMRAPAAHHALLTRGVRVLNRLSDVGFSTLMSEDCVAGECAHLSLHRVPGAAARRRRDDQHLLPPRRHRRLEGVHRPAGRGRRGARLAHRDGRGPAGQRPGGGGAAAPERSARGPVERGRDRLSRART
ncbi:alpha/beta hydrolase [Nocardioides sp. W3-2-3]|nr:alpha/beta hydrolase [Nocardioides convexus]